jgi:hypothetical protein
VQNNDPEPEPKEATPVQRPEYICPTGMHEIFLCEGCGGGKNIGEWTIWGEPNAECIGVSFSNLGYECHDERR